MHLTGDGGTPPAPESNNVSTPALGDGLDRSTLRAASRYILQRELGSGSYGTVFLAVRKLDRSMVAIKKSHINANGLPPETLREVNNLRLLKHPNIVSMTDYFIDTTERTVSLVMEFCEYDLSKYMSRYHQRQMPSSTVRSFCRQLLLAVSHCHGIGVMHRDIKPANILVDTTDSVLKLGDFGLSRRQTCDIGVPLTPDVVTIWYRAPELLLHGEYSRAVDMWSVGCVLSEMAQGAALFPGSSEIETLFLILRCGIALITLWKFLNTPPIRRGNMHAWLIAPPCLCLYSRLLTPFFFH